MAFPIDANPVLAHMLIDGVMTDVTDDIRGSNESINITRGRRDIMGRMPPTTCDFMLNNGGELAADRGKYTDDNPLSPYFEKLPLYTQFRLVIPAAADGYFYAPGYDRPNYFVSADKAQLDITGDIDIMAEIDPASWFVPVRDMENSNRDRTIIMSKSGDTSTQFSWAFSISTYGQLCFTFSPTGNAGAGLTSNSASVPVATGRLAVRVTFDVNNGLGGYTSSFYTAPTIDGTWTLLSQTVNTTFGAAPIFSGTGNLEIGSGWGGTGLFTGWHTWSGKIYATRIYNGFFGSGGTLVAEANFRALGVGTEVFADGLGNTFTQLGTGSYVTSDAVRFWGELESLPQEWDSTGKDMYVRVHAADLIQRLQTSQTPLASPIYQNRIALNPKGYWTFQDGAGSTWASAASPNTKAASVKFVTFKADDDLPGSDGAAQFQNGGAFIRGEPRITSITGTASMLWFFKMGTLPVTTVQVISGQVTGSSTVKWWRLETDGSSFTIRAFAPDGTSLLTSSYLTGGVDMRNWISMRIELTTSGANIAWALAWVEVGASNFLGGSGTIAGSVGRFVGFTVNGSSNNTDMFIAHVVLDTATTSFVNDDFYNAANAYIGELFGDRYRRLCEQEGIVPELDGWYYETAPVGRQRVDTVLNNLYDGAAVDGGILVGSRRRGNALTYITRSRIGIAPKVTTLQHDTGSQLAATPKPTRDSNGVMNDITVSRPGGGSSRQVITSGRYGTDSIGTVLGGGEFNVATDEQTATIAGELASLGTDPGARFPNIMVMLQRQETLFASTIAQQLLTADVGRWLEITNMPAGQKPGPVEQLIQGYQETLSNKDFTLNFNGTSYTFWRNYLSNFSIARAQATATTCGAANSTATSLTFTTAAGSARWATAADLLGGVFVSFAIMIAGEMMTLTNVTGTTNVQTATVVRSVNAVIKNIPAGSPVTIYRITTAGR